MRIGKSTCDKCAYYSSTVCIHFVVSVYIYGTRYTEDVLVKELKEIGDHARSEITDSISEKEPATMKCTSTGQGKLEVLT